MSEPIEDKLFGTLSYDASVRWYRAQVEFSPGRRVELSISVEGVDPDAAVEQAHQIFPRVQSQGAALRRAAAQEKLALYNDHWSQGERIDADEFARRITLSSITIHPEGEVESWTRTVICSPGIGLQSPRIQSYSFSMSNLQANPMR